MDGMSYYYDQRTRAANLGRWYENFDERSMTATMWKPDDDGDDEELVTVAVEYDVCPICEGKGTHVNPSIDAHGLSAEDFGNDPDFLEDYLGGVYDQVCNECYGKRVVPIPSHSLAKGWMDEVMDNREAMYAEQLSELRMGA